MNNIYRVIWSHAKGGWTVASELAVANRGGGGQLRRNAHMPVSMLRRLPWALACILGGLAVCSPAVHADESAVPGNQQMERVDSRLADLGDLLAKYGNAQEQVVRRVAPSTVATNPSALPNQGAVTPSQTRMTAVSHASRPLAPASRQTAPRNSLSPQLANDAQIASVLARRHSSTGVETNTAAVPEPSGASTWVVGRDGSIGVIPATASAGTPVTGALSGVVDGARNVVSKVVHAGGGSPLGGVTGAVGGVVDGARNVVSKVVQAGGGSPLGGVTGAVGDVVDGAKTVVTKVVQAGSGSPLGGVTGAVGGVVDGAKTVVTKIVHPGGGSPLGGVTGDVVDGAKTVVTKVVHSGDGSPLGGVTGAVGNVVDGAETVVSKIVHSGDGSPLGGVTGAVGDVVDGAKTVVTKVVHPGDGSPLGGVTGAVGDVVNGAKNVVSKVVHPGDGSPLGGVTGVVGDVVEGAKTVVTKVVHPGDGSPLGGVTGAVGDVVDGAKNVVTKVVHPGDGSPLGGVTGAVGDVLKGTRNAVTDVVAPGNSVEERTIGAVGDALGGVKSAVSDLARSNDGDTPVGHVTGAVGGVLQGAKNAVTDVVKPGNSLQDRTLGAVGDLLNGVKQGVSQVIQPGDTKTGVAVGTVADLSNGAKDVVSDLTAPESSLKDRVTGAVGDVLGSAGSIVGRAVPQLPGEQAKYVEQPSTRAMSAQAVVQAVPSVPAPSNTPTGLIVSNAGQTGTVSSLLGTTENVLFQNSSTSTYITSGGLKISSANITQGYSTLNLLGKSLLNMTAVGTLLTSTDGTVVGGTGINSHLTLVGAVTSGNYISDINNGYDDKNNGLLGLVLPSSAPAWASTCMNVLGVLKEQCWGVNAAQDNQVLMGDGASANGSEEVVIGTNASHTLPVESANTVFRGSGTRDSESDPMGVPDANYQARKGHSVVIGDSASGTQDMQTILGANASSSKANSVALGYGSNADRGSLGDYTTAFGLAGKTQHSAGEVAVGNTGHERQITHVAAGTDAYDAVNVKQLEGAINDVSSGGKLAVKYDADTNGDATNTVTLVGDGTGKQVALTNLSAGVLDSSSTDAVNGSQLFATNSILSTYLGGTTNYDGSTNTWTPPDFKISNIALDGTVTVGDYDNVTEAFEHLNTSLVNVNKRIKNSGPGGGSSKYFQANSTGAAADASGTESVAMGGNTVAKGDNSVAAGNGAQAQSNDAIAIGHGATASGGQAVAIGPGAQATGDGAVSIGDPNVATGTGAVAQGKDNTATGTGAVALGNTNTAQGAGAVALGSTSNATADGAVAIGNGASSTVEGGVALGAGSVADRVDSVSVGSTGHERQVTNVAAGTANTDAVNVAQLKASEHGTVRYDTYDNGDTNYNSVTLGDPKGGGGTTVIHNVGPGKADTDAANVGQLNAVKNWAQQYTDQRVDAFNRALNNLGNHAYAGVASAMAMAGLPQAYLPGKNMASFAASSFHGESSIAVGVSMISDNGRWVYKLSGTDNSRGDAGVAIGAGIQW